MACCTLSEPPASSAGSGPDRAPGRSSRRLAVAALLLTGPFGGAGRAHAQTGPVLDVEVDGTMAPVTARIVLACPDTDGRPVTHLLAFGEPGDWEIVRDSRISISRAFRARTVVRGACRDERGRLRLAHSRTVVAVDAAHERDAVIDLVNAERARNGLNPLAHDTGLDEVAAAHARDMAERRYFSHVTPEGRDLGARLRAAKQFYRGAAENLAGDETPQHAVRAWLGSEGHRENLLSPGYDRTGVGVYRTPSSPYTYYVQVFAR